MRLSANVEAGTLVSCVIPVYGGEHYLREAVDSVLNQDYAPIEIIVVDDGSTDDCAAVASSYGDPVLVVRQEHQGPAEARNAGIRMARGSFVCFLDSDDVYRPGKVARQLDHFMSNPQLDVSLCVAENFWEAGLEEEEQEYRSRRKVLISHIFSTLMARRHVFDEVGLLDASLRDGGERLDWFLRLATADLETELSGEVLVSRRMHPGSMSHNLSSLDQFVDVIKGVLDARRP